MNKVIIILSDGLQYTANLSVVPNINDLIDVNNGLYQVYSRRFNIINGFCDCIYLKVEKI